MIKPLPKYWKIKKLGEICNISLGKTPARGNKGFWDAEKKTSNVWLSIRDLNNTVGKEIFDSKEYISDEGAKLFKNVKKGTLLASFKLTLGRLAFAGIDLRTNEAIAALEIRNNDEIINEYLYYYLTFFDWHGETKGDVKIKGKTLNKSKLKEIIVLLPPIPEQHRIVKLLDGAFAKLEISKTNAEKNLVNAKELFESYLNGVFTDPEGIWESKKWGQLCNFVRGPFGGSLKKSIFVDKGFAVYEQKHAIHDHFNQLRYFIDDEKFEEMRRFEVIEGDLIMSCSGVTLGRVAIIPKGIPRGIINQALLKLTPKKEITVHFLKYWLRSKIFQDIIIKSSGGAAIPNVPSAKILKEIEIPVPPLKEQNELVKRFDVILAETNKLEQIYQQKLEDLEELKKSILQKAFAGEL
jgi:type I restriction enzyme, S subunit